MTWWRRMLRRRALERELDAELRDHIAREIAEGVRAGQSEADVRRQIRLTSGGLDQVKEACRDVRRPRALADLAGIPGTQERDCNQAGRERDNTHASILAARVGLVC